MRQNLDERVFKDNISNINNNHLGIIHKTTDSQTVLGK